MWMSDQIGFTGKKDCVTMVLSALEAQQYHRYTSAGLAVCYTPTGSPFVPMLTTCVSSGGATRLCVDKPRNLAKSATVE